MKSSAINIKEQKLNRIACIVSGIVFALVLVMRRVKLEVAFDFSFLPLIYSVLNLLTAVLLIIGLIFIKQKQIDRHKKTMIVALVSSTLFLLLYVLYHFTTEETKYCGDGGMRIVYFVLLITHIVTAAGILPFILLTFNRAITNEFVRHKKMARWVFPIWLYVALSGPIVYLMLLPCFG